MGSEKKLKDETLEKYKRVIDEWLHNGENGTKAYQSVYTTSSDVNAASRFLEIVRISEISDYAKEQKEIKAAKVEKEHGFTFDKQVKDQLRKKEIFEMLVELGTKEELTEKEKERFDRLQCIISINGINKADDILNKMLGYDAAIKIAETDASGNDKESDYSKLTTAELIARANAARAIKENE